MNTLVATCTCISTDYLHIQIPPGQLRGSHIQSTAVPTSYRSTIEGTMRVLCSYCMCSSLSAFCHSRVRVPSYTVLRNMRRSSWLEESGCVVKRRLSSFRIRKDLNKLSTLGENPHTFNFRHVAHVFIRRNPMLLWGLLTSLWPWWHQSEESII